MLVDLIDDMTDYEVPEMPSVAVLVDYVVGRITYQEYVQRLTDLGKEHLISPPLVKNDDETVLPIWDEDRECWI